MGVWDFMRSSIDQTKQKAPNLSSVKNACWSSYNYTSYAVKKIDNTVRGVNANGIQRFYSSYWPDADARTKIGLFAKIFTANTADYAMHEGIKLLPGGKAFSKIVSQTMRDVKSESNKKQQMKAVQTKVGPGEDSMDCRNLIDQPHDAKSSSRNTHGFEKPEDVIGKFMATELIGNRILADLMVTEISRGKEHK